MGLTSAFEIQKLAHMDTPEKLPQRVCEPAKSIVARFGGEAKIAEVLSISPTIPYAWQYPREKKGTGGTIPQRYHLALLDHAQANGIDLSPADFLPVREVA